MFAIYSTCSNIPHIKIFCNCTLAIPGVFMQGPVWLFSVDLWCRASQVCWLSIFWMNLRLFHLDLLLVRLVCFYIPHTHTHTHTQTHCISVVWYWNLKIIETSFLITFLSSKLAVYGDMFLFYYHFYYYYYLSCSWITVPNSLVILS